MNMNIQTIYETILEEVLPTPWSRKVAAITLPLSISSLALPNFLKTIDMELIPEASLYIRLVLPLLILLTGTFTVLLLVVRHHKTYRTKASNTENDMQQYWKYHDKITLSLGAYHDIKTKNGDKFFRIVLKDISQRDMPPPYDYDSVPAEIQTEVATIGFEPGFFIYPGSRVKKVATSPFFNEECFYMPKNESQEASYSVFFFHTEHVTDGEQFFRCFVDHINPVKKEVDINIFFIWLKKAQQ